MKKVKETIVKKTDAVHLMGLGTSVTGTCSDKVGMIYIGSLKKQQKLRTKVRNKNIDEDSIASYILFCSIESVNQMIDNLNEIKKGMKKKRK
jgi:hypothetical protein